MITLKSGDSFQLETDNDGMYLSSIDGSYAIPDGSAVIRLDMEEIESLIYNLFEILAELKAFHSSK